MDNKKVFQWVVLGIFSAFILLGMLCFGQYLPFCADNNDDDDTPTEKTYGVVSVWGTMRVTNINKAFRPVNDKYNIAIRYRYIPPEDFEFRFLEALANNTQPDLLFLNTKNASLFEKYVDRISFSERTFLDTYAEVANVLVKNNKVLFLPLIVDPLVMYWNRDQFTTNLVYETPSNWEDVVLLAPTLTVRDVVTVSKSAVPMGTFDNIKNASSILAAMMIQAGDRIYGPAGGVEVGHVGDVARYYMQFSDPLKPTYTWNDGLPSSDKQFATNDLAMYWGFASELTTMKQINPHLNIDVVLLPQIRDTERKSTYAIVHGVALVKKARNKAGAQFLLSLLRSPTWANNFSESTSLPPAHRSLLRNRPEDPFLNVFYDSAFLSKSFLDRSPELTEEAFGKLINDVLSGDLDIGGALGPELEEILGSK